MLKKKGQFLKVESRDIVFCICIATTVLLIGAILLLSAVPPISRDALVHHLAVPKLYLEHGRILELPCMDYSYYPMNLDLLYLGALYLGSDIAAKYIHFLFGVLTAWLIFRYLKTRLGRYYGAIGALIFLTIPVILKLSITVYVDLGLVFFSFAALLLIIRWKTKGYLARDLISSGICAGLAMGTKYSGLVVFFVLITVIIYFHVIHRKKNNNHLVKSILVFSLTSFIFFSPWLIRNYVWTGNPIYPLYANHFPQEKNACSLETMSSLKGAHQFNHFQFRKEILGEDWLDIILLPIRIFTDGRDGSNRYFDGKLSVVLLMFPVFAFVLLPNKSDSKMDEKFVFLLFSILLFGIIFFLRPIRVRYYAPFIPCLVCLSVYGIRNIVAAFKGTKLILKKCLLLTILALGIGYSAVHTGSYMIEQFQYVQPLTYLSGKFNRDEYILKFRPEYAAMIYINEVLPKNTKILFLYIGKRGYYCNREYLPDQGRNTDKLREIAIAKGPSGLSNWLKEKNISHILINNRLVKESLSTKKNREKEEFIRFMVSKTDKLFDQNGYSLYCL